MSEPVCEIRPATKWNLKRLGGAIVLVFGLYVLMQTLGLLRFSPSVGGPSSLGAVFIVGLVAAFSSCTAVVGGLVVAVSASAAKRGAHLSVAQKIRPQLLFNAGRLIGFAGFGALIGLLGQAVNISTSVNAVLIFAIAILMILLGVNLLDIVPAHLDFFRPPMWLSRRIYALADSPNPFVPFALGALTFFLPCGFTQSMQLYAISLGSPSAASLTMFVFALGTLPALLGIGVVSAAMRGKSLKLMTQAAGALVIVLGVSNVQNSIALFGWSAPASARVVASSDLPEVIDGKQLVQMEITPEDTYSPDVITVAAGIPVDWQVWGADNMGCTSVLVLNAFGVRQSLVPGNNDVEFTPTEPGTYTFSCSMGMVRGTMVVKDAS